MEARRRTVSHRETLLQRVRAALAEQPVELPLPTGATPGSPEEWQLPRDRLASFSEILTQSGGSVHSVRNLSEAVQAFRRLVEELGLERIAISDATELHDFVAAVPDARWTLAQDLLEGSPGREDLFDCQAGLHLAQGGVAETGTLILDSRKELHRLTSLVPPVDIAILWAREIHANLGSALGHFEEHGLPPTLTLVTGPSRTADIELELVVGVHGPAVLHVILITEES